MKPKIEIDQASLSPVPCQFCGGNHREDYYPKAKEMLARQIESTDGQIDRLVYALSP